MTTRVNLAKPTQNRPQNIGASIDDQTGRLDAVPKVTGSAKFSRDIYPPNALFIAFYRCPYGNAKLGTIDIDAANRIKGVLEVERLRDECSYHGQPAGYIVAESPAALRRGLTALNVTWKRGAVKTRIIDGMEPTPEPNDETKRILKDADHVLEATYTTAVQTHSPLETHGASIDHRGDSATAYISTQGTFAATDGLGEALGLDEAQFEVVCEYIGGGFGSKLNGAGKEGATAARVAAKYKRPAYLFCNRAEDHLDTGNRPSSRVDVKVGFTSDGTIIGGLLHTRGGVGVGGGGGVRFPSGRYGLGDLQRSHEDVNTNAGAPRAFRAPGCPQGAFAEELMLDEVATIAGVDPIELRLRLELDDDRKEMLRKGAELIGWSNRTETGSQTGTVRRGFGVGTASWGRFPARAEGEIVIKRDGSVEVRTGSQDIGTGQRTIMGVLAADGLGIPLEVVSVRIGRSSLPIAPGSGGSMTAHNTAPAMIDAAADARQKLLEIVADHIGAAASDLSIEEGVILRDGQREMSWAEACRLLPAEQITGRGSWSRRALRDDETTGHSHGAQFVDLRVDTQTGVISVDRIIAFQACGRVVARKTAESQIIGGVIQGVSYALFEDKILDRNTGTMVNPNFEWYKILGTGDMPLIEPILWTKNQTGVRSLGEPPTIPTAGAIACAVYNAIGAPVRDIPLTPARVLAVIEGDRA